MVQERGNRESSVGKGNRSEQRMSTNKLSTRPPSMNGINKQLP